MNRPMPHMEAVAHDPLPTTRSPQRAVGGIICQPIAMSELALPVVGVGLEGIKDHDLRGFLTQTSREPHHFLTTLRAFLHRVAAQF
jgi:hypothetical protein